MKRFKRGQRGFTMIELLIVIAILGVLAAVVIPSVLGMSSRGGSETWRVDANTIHAGAVNYYTNTHHPGGINSEPTGHFWPTYSGLKNDDVDSIWQLYFNPNETAGNRYAYTEAVLTGGVVDPAKCIEANRWEWADFTAEANLTDTAIIAMPLLTNMTDGFFGPYIDVPDSAHNVNRHFVDVDPDVNPGLSSDDLTVTGSGGSHCWVIGAEGKVFSIYPSDVYIKVELTKEDFNKWWP